MTADVGRARIRPMEKKDLYYVIDSWLRTYKESPAMRQPGLVHKDYYRLTHLQLNELIARASACESAWVMYDPDLPQRVELLGYLIGEWFKDHNTAIIHWCQVKKRLWNRGVASSLIDFWKVHNKIPEDNNILYTFASQQLRPRHPSDDKHGFPQHAKNKYNLVYYPWFAFTSMPPGWEVDGS